MRILMCLAKADTPMTMPVLSESLCISYNHLSKLVQKLRKAQMVKTLQGKHGGVAIKMAPEDITLRMVVDLIDGPTALSDCLDDENACGFSCDCRLKQTLGTLQAQFNAMMDDITVKNLVEN